nr:ankyrin repeat domain-containing protein [Rubripirellula tenax]
MHQFVWYESPLHFAVRENQIEVARVLIEAGINPAFSNFNYRSWQSLLSITKERCFDALHRLLVREMKNRFDYDPGYAPLWQAITAGEVERVKELIDASPELGRIGDEHGNRAIHWAILARRIPIIELLLDCGVDINAKRADLQSPLHLALVGDYWFGKKNSPDPETSSQQIADFIRNSGADHEFSVAVAFNDIEHVRSELARNSGLANEINSSRRSPLYFGSSRGHLEMVQLLLESGADPNLAEHCASRGRALFEASSRNDVEMMSLLLAHAADANANVDSCGNCLSIAQQGGPREAEAIALLTKHGALAGEWEIDTKEKLSKALDSTSFIPNRDIWSSVLGKIIEEDSVDLLEEYVARFGYDDIVRLNPANGRRLPRSKEMLTKLVELGTNINARDWYGRTFLHHASYGESLAIPEFLIEAGIDIDAIDHQSATTALGLAAWKGNVAMVDLLLDANADPLLPLDRHWARPFAYAKAQGHDKVVERLRRYETN